MSKAPDRSRSLPVKGLFNARDLGGLPAADGSVIAPARLFRSEVLVSPEEPGIHSKWVLDDSPSLVALGVRTVIDLRGVDEAHETPSAWAQATGARAALCFPIHDGGHGAPRDFVNMLITGELERFAPEDLGRHYIAILSGRARTFGAAISAIAAGAPALIHCTEGKDRTGILVALILDALGTPHADIVDDYVLTSALRPDRALAYAPHFASANVPLESFRVLYEAPAVAMTMALDYLAAHDGGVCGYLINDAEVSVDTIQRLREELLIPAPGAHRAAGAEEDL